MFEIKTMAEIEKLTQRELESAKIQHGEKFNSLHEAYAVTLEEIEEAEEEMDKIKKEIENFWKICKEDTESKSDLNCCLKKIHNHCRYAVAELLQVSAMSVKAMESEL